MDFSGLQCQPLPIVHPYPFTIISKICSRLSWKQYLSNNLFNNQQLLRLVLVCQSLYLHLSTVLSEDLLFPISVCLLLLASQQEPPFPMRKLRTWAITLMLTFHFISLKNAVCLARYISDWMLESHGQHQTVTHTPVISPKFSSPKQIVFLKIEDKNW